MEDIIEDITENIIFDKEFILLITELDVEQY
jgi:hypothetical protein